MLSIFDVVMSPCKTIIQKARDIWPEVYILWFAMVGQIISIATPYWSRTSYGYSGLWKDCIAGECISVFEYGDPSHWLRCVQIVVCLSLPLTLLAAIFLLLASTKTNTNCSTPGGFASLTVGCMLLLGGGFYGYQQNATSSIGWSLLVSVVSGCMCVFCSTRMIINCIKREDEVDVQKVFKPGPTNL
ncbi:hypothetical protein SNE40_021943 [Patella caerulea]|uniref:Uncharacterized protein n=1 Tax=Patella caerulea TaxID=87958 RepID=A0AAN8G144_PATCE